MEGWLNGKVIISHLITYLFRNECPSGKLWVTTHRFVFQMNSMKNRSEGLFEVPFEIFVKESYTGGMFQSGHRVKIKRDGSKASTVYDSNTLNVMIQNLASQKSEELKLDAIDIEQGYKLILSQRILPNKVTLFCPSKAVRNKIKKCIDDVVVREEWTKVKFDINQHIRKSDMGIGNIMGRQKERDNVISTKLAMTFGDNSAAHELVDIANDIKKRLAKFKDQFPNYQENAEIMDMIFELGMNNDDDEIYVQESLTNLSKKDFKKKLVQDLVDFLDENIKSYGGWVPLAELYCKFNRKMGLEVISPEEFTDACNGLAKFTSSDGSYYIHERTFPLKNGDTWAMITHPEYSIKKKSNGLSKKLQKKNGVGLTNNDIVSEMKMNFVVIDQIIENSIIEGKIAVDEQDPAGKRYYHNRIMEYNIDDIAI